ncbi:conidial pigment biosynthesis scytalone dehydratase Arp1 [Diplocarpon rosae]|nr:conidial pigment biosynthesis scytalone dehydratase Arp1 [Diplocarpon rosae]
MLQSLVFDWADSYDAKDWERLRSILAPTLHVDYTSIGKPCLWPQLSAADFMRMVTSERFLGNACLQTQHMLGAHYYERISDTQIIGHHQIRAAHQLYTSPDRTAVKLKGHVHASNVHFYTSVDGVWKFAGLKPTVRWSEHEFEKVFTGMDEEPRALAGQVGAASTTDEDVVVPVSGEGGGELKDPVVVSVSALDPIDVAG